MRSFPDAACAEVLACLSNGALCWTRKENFTESVKFLRSIRSRALGVHLPCTKMNVHMASKFHLPILVSDLSAANL